MNLVSYDFVLLVDIVWAKDQPSAVKEDWDDGIRDGMYPLVDMIPMTTE